MRGSLFASKKIITPLRLLLLLAVLVLPILHWESSAQAAGRTVRVGWFHSDMFQEGMADDKEKSGYCYDYLQKIADYTNWQYEYVYGEWPELFHKLQTGEIDVLGGVSMTEERKATMLFPDSAMGNDQYYLYKKANNTDILTEDLATLKGKRIGGIVDNRMTTFTEKWLQENKVEAEMVYFTSFAQQEAAFQRGEIDLLTQTINNVLTMKDIAIVAKVGEEPFYLAVKKSGTDILGQMNASLNNMLSLDPFILQNLQYANYGANLTSKTLSAEELLWLEGHDSVVVGYLEDYLPYSGTSKEGKVTGLVKDLLEGMPQALQQLGPKIEYRPYSSYEAMVSDLKQGKIDTAFPVYGNFYHLEKEKIDASSNVLGTSLMVFYRGEYERERLQKIAVCKNNRVQVEVTKKEFPQAEFCYFDKINDCLEAVLQGKADGVILSSLRTELVKGNSRYQSLNYQQLNESTNLCFGVSEDNPTLLLLLNRGLRILGPSYGLANAQKYVAELYEFSLADYFHQHLLGFGLAIASFIGLIIALLLRDVRRKAASVKEIGALNEKLQEHERQLQTQSDEKQAQLEEIIALNEILREEHSKLEEARKEAEAANNAKTTFLFNMSHDIRTPMNAIIGFRDLLEKYQDNPERRTEYLRKMEASSNVLLSIINNVLEMARIENGSVEVVEEPWTDRQFNDTFYSIFQEMMTQKGITFTRSFDVRHHNVLCDPAKLREIFINLLSNAYKYTKPGGTVSMEVKEIPSDRPDIALYQTTISDTGIGMAEEFLPHIFEEFSRERNTTEAKIEGTGLGMPIVKQLVDLLGGTITVTSKKGVGSTFVVTIPHKIMEKAEAAPAPQGEADLQRFKGKRILLAEDYDFNAEIAMEMLEDLGFEVDRAEDGQICVDMLAKAPQHYYDLVLMDIQMPNMNGYDAARLIRAMEEQDKAELPILAMTANAFTEDKMAALKAGMDGHLAKPVRIPELVRALAGILGR